MSPVGTPVVKMHLEVETDYCTCHRVAGCGGVDGPHAECPEHGQLTMDSRFHTHAMQVDKISVGTLAL